MEKGRRASFTGDGETTFRDDCDADLFLPDTRNLERRGDDRRVWDVTNFHSGNRRKRKKGKPGSVRANRTGRKEKGDAPGTQRNPVLGSSLLLLLGVDEHEVLLRQFLSELCVPLVDGGGWRGRGRCLATRRLWWVVGGGRRV